MTVTKEKAIAFVRSEIEILAEQSDEREALAYVNRIKGYQSLLLVTGIMSLDEMKPIGEEFGRARLIAEAKVEKAKYI